MSELQLGLIVLGVLIVIGVYGFNRYQERQLQRRAHEGMRAPSVDDARRIGVQDPADPDRVEPRIVTPSATGGDEKIGTEDAHRSARGATAELAPSAVASNVPNLPIDYVCRIDAADPLPLDALNRLLGDASTIGKHVNVYGFDIQAQQWVGLPCAASTIITQAVASLQLADRAGAANRVQLSTLRDLVQRLCDDLGAASECPRIDQAAQAAADLDRFCAEVDISLGCNVIPSEGSGLAGTKLRGLLESAGFALDASGRFLLRSEDGVVLVSAEDIEGSAFTPERLRTTAVAGLTFSMDVPRVPNGARNFDRMIDLARHLAHALDASVVDDNRAALSESGLKLIRQQLSSVHDAMHTRGIPAGSALAARLFA